VSLPIFETRTFRIQVRNVAAWANFLVPTFIVVEQMTFLGILNDYFQIHIVKCRRHVTRDYEITGSRSDVWIYWCFLTIPAN
jgi:hypothetical protein